MRWVKQVSILRELSILRSILRKVLPWGVTGGGQALRKKCAEFPEGRCYLKSWEIPWIIPLSFDRENSEMCCFLSWNLGIGAGSTWGEHMVACPTLCLHLIFCLSGKCADFLLQENNAYTVVSPDGTVRKGQSLTGSLPALPSPVAGTWKALTGVWWNKQW